MRSTSVLLHWVIVFCSTTDVWAFINTQMIKVSHMWIFNDRLQCFDATEYTCLFHICLGVVKSGLPRSQSESATGFTGGSRRHGRSREEQRRHTISNGVDYGMVGTHMTAAPNFSNPLLLDYLFRKHTVLIGKNKVSANLRVVTMLLFSLIYRKLICNDFYWI